MVNHKHVSKGSFWAPPGGGMEFGQDAISSLIREYKEETGLDVTVGKLQFVCELMKSPLHAVEMFFNVTLLGGELIKGIDPEHDAQIIDDVKFMTMEEILALSPDERHGIFQFGPTAEKLKLLTGYWRI